ncbi:uncharacterized protein TNCV_1222281 [Trichonephila clavipes]|nr:uncharacterized protein TNCV_1222281 [Trichonephila clavipes]
MGARAAGVHYRLFSVWTLVPVRLDQQLSDHSTVDEIAPGAADCRLTYTMVNCPQRRKREREKEEKRARKRQGLVVLGSGEENPRVLFGDADQESETRMSKNALGTGRKQAVELSNATETVSVSSADLEGQGVNRRVNLKDLVPKFDAKNADINLFFEIFERQAKKEKVAEDRWVSQLIPLLPIEIAEIVAKEPLEKSDDYPHIKNLLLARFRLTPIALRDRFESHQRRPGAMWADLVFELRSYLDNWLAGMKVGDFAALKELLVTEQIKKEHQVN